MISPRDTKDKLRGAVFGSFAGDSLALGVHWIYDTKEILTDYGRVTSLIDPSPDLYHPTRKKGEFTHYGDQALVLLESVAIKGGFDPEDSSQRWLSLFENYDGYVDQATRSTLRNYSLEKDWKDAGSASEDLAGASRIAPLVYRYSNNLDALVEASRTQTKMTHNHPLVIEAAEFFARSAYAVVRGTNPISAMTQTLDDFFKHSRLTSLFEAGLKTIDEKTTPAITRLGQGCDVTEAFPSVVHLIAKYQENFEEALIECVMAGGDSAARAMAVGMVLGAHVGEHNIPRKWLSGLKARQEINNFLDMVDKRMTISDLG